MDANEIVDVVENSRKLHGLFKLITDEVIEDIKLFANYNDNAFRKDAREEAFILGMQNVVEYIIKMKSGETLSTLEVLEKKENAEY
jgi:hypothetical protein